MTALAVVDTREPIRDACPGCGRGIQRDIRVDTTTGRYLDPVWRHTNDLTPRCPQVAA